MSFGTGLSARRLPPSVENCGRNRVLTGRVESFNVRNARYSLGGPRDSRVTVGQRERRRPRREERKTEEQRRRYWRANGGPTRKERHADTNHWREQQHCHDRQPGLHRNLPLAIRAFFWRVVLLSANS